MFSLSQCAKQCEGFNCKQFSYRNSSSVSRGEMEQNCILSHLYVSNIIRTIHLVQNQNWDIYEQVCNESSLVTTSTSSPTILTSSSDIDYYDDYGSPISTTTPFSTNTSRNLTQLRKRRSADDDNLFSTTFTFNISITTESLVSLLLLQLPGVCLGLFGIIKAFQTHGFNEDGCKDAAR